MAILADSNKTWRPDRYHKKIWESEITRTYKVIKLIDYKSRVEELKNHPNPFALVVLVQLAALETKSKGKRRFLTKLELTRALHKHNWPEEKSINMYRFLDLILGLSPNYEVQYIEQVKRIEEEFNMAFTLTAERHGIKQGIEQGIEQGVQLGGASLLLKLIETKFKTVPPACVEKINHADMKTLNQWGVNFVKAESLEEIF